MSSITSSKHNSCFLDSLLQYTESIVEWPLWLIQYLLSSPSDHNGARLSQRHTGETNQLWVCVWVWVYVCVGGCVCASVYVCVSMSMCVWVCGCECMRVGGCVCGCECKSVCVSVYNNRYIIHSWNLFYKSFLSWHYENGYPNTIIFAIYKLDYYTVCDDKLIRESSYSQNNFIQCLHMYTCRELGR